MSSPAPPKQPHQRDDDFATRCEIVSDELVIDAGKELALPGATTTRPHLNKADVSRAIDEIARTHRRFRSHFCKSLQTACELGSQIVILRDGVGWGNWGPVASKLQAKLRVSRRTLDLYASVAEHWHHVEAAIDDDPTLASTLTLRNFRTFVPKKTEAKEPDVAVLTAERRSPSKIIEAVALALNGIETDPTADDEKRVDAKTHFVLNDDGLANVWHRNAYVFIDDAAALEKWIDLAYYQLGDTLQDVVFFLPSDTTSTEHLNRLMRSGATIVFLGLRLAFAGERRPVPTNSCLVHLGEHPERFAEACGPLGKMIGPVISNIAANSSTNDSE